MKTVGGLDRLLAQAQDHDSQLAVCRLAKDLAEIEVVGEDDQAFWLGLAGDLLVG